MVAVVVRSGCGRSIGFRVTDKICIVEVGRRVPIRKLKKALQQFGEGFILGGGFDESFSSALTPFSHFEFAEKLLFNAFLKVASKGEFCKVGVVCSAVVPHTVAAKLLSFVSELVLIEDVAEEFLKECIVQYGTCPDIGRERDLYTCDAVFAPRGLSGFDGVLFGKGGIAVCGEGLLPPPYMQMAREFGVDPVQLLALLDAETGGKYRQFVPPCLQENGNSIPTDRFFDTAEKILL